MSSNEVANQVNKPIPNAGQRLWQTGSVKCIDLIPQDLRDVLREYEREVANYFMSKIHNAIQSKDLRGALVAYNELDRYASNCGVSELDIVSLLNKIADAFGISQGDLARQLASLEGETPDLGTIIGEIAKYIRMRVRYPLTLSALKDSIIVVIDEGSEYRVIHRLIDPVTKEPKVVDVKIPKKELSRALNMRETYDVRKGKKGKVEVLDTGNLVPRILEGQTVNFAIAHYEPRGFTSYDYAVMLVYDVFPTKLIGRSKVDEIKWNVMDWLMSRTYTYVSYNGGSREATVKRVDPTEAIYIDPTTKELLVPPGAYLANIKDANKKNQITAYLKLHGILIDTNKPYTIHVNKQKKPLKGFYVFDLTKLREFVEHGVEELAKPDRENLLLSQNEIEKIKKKSEGDVA
jgi:hypothetical protein